MYSRTVRRALFPSIRRALREAEERRERQRAEESLRESEERLRTVIQHMPVLMVAFDQQGNIVAWNRECEHVTGYKADEMVGDPKVNGEALPPRRAANGDDGGVALAAA